MDKNALQHICKAFNTYVEKWPGWHPREQEEIKQILLGLNKALLDMQLLDD